MSQSSNGSNCSYEKRRIVDSAEMMKHHYDLKKVQLAVKKALVDPKPLKPRVAKQNASKTISEITARVTRSSQTRNLPLASKLP